MHRIRPLVTVESPGCATHDTSRVSHHIQDIKDFLATVEQATRSAFPNSGKSRYQAVHVLLLSWADDDLGVLRELDRLSKVFKELYGFNVEEWLIPSEDSHGELGDRLRAFTKTRAREDALLIVYYGGHGFLNDYRQPIWLCSQKVGAPSVKWYAHQVTLEEVKSDVFILLDCCSAGGTGGDATKGTKEVIAACGFETWAPGVGDHSFTKSVIDELKYLSTGPSFSVSSLHSRVLDRLKHWNPVYNAERLLIEGPEGRYQDQERRKTPVYISLNKERSAKSIEVVPRLGTRNEGRAERNASAGTPTDDIDETLVAMTDFMKDDRYKHVEVTLSVQVETGQILNPNDMVDWIKELPLLAKSVRLQAVIPSMSTLLVLSLPVATWNLLPSNPACSFAGFTTSTNLLLSNYDVKVPGTSGSTVDTITNRATERPEIKNALPRSHNRKPTTDITLDPVLESNTSRKHLEFWVPGRVFKISWTKNTRDVVSSSETSSIPIINGWEVFIVLSVKRELGFAYCCPIRNEEAIRSRFSLRYRPFRYTRLSVVKLPPGEQPVNSSQLQKPLRIIPNNPKMELVKSSYVDHAILWPIDFNVEVIELGQLDEESRNELQRDVASEIRSHNRDLSW